MRLRFAPSPTGTMHVGNARTALFNWLAARHAGGELALRVEDTDLARSEERHVDTLLDALSWLGIDFDGEMVRQSERADRHRDVLDALLADGRAYRSGAVTDDVKAFRAREGRGFRGDEQVDGAVRLRLPDAGQITVVDLVYGSTELSWRDLDDPVIARGDGTPLYNLAATVDDADMAITHVVRGEDHRNNGNTALQTAIYTAIGAPVPVFAHLPLLLGADGKKLSKRHGGASVQELRDAGYPAEAVVNYLALLGWGDRDSRTLLSSAELIDAFELERVTVSPAKVDPDKLAWISGQKLRSMDLDQLTAELETFTGRENLRDVARVAQPKLERSMTELLTLVGYALDGPADDPKARAKWLTEPGRQMLAAARELLAEVAWEPAAVQHALEQLAEQRDVGMGKVAQPLRVALTGRTVSPGIGETVTLLDRAEALRRVDDAVRGADAQARR